MAKANYDGAITLNRTKLTVHVYRYVRYSNGENNLLDDSTHSFKFLEDAMLFAERMATTYKHDGVQLTIKN